MRVFLAGATGYIGRAVARELIHRGITVVCMVRAHGSPGGKHTLAAASAHLDGAELRTGAVTDYESVLHDGMRGEHFDAVISCLATRSGGVRDAWDIEYHANLNLLRAAQALHVQHFVLLSAICVQEPELAFQHAKLKFEAALQASGLRYSIVRPTAFFKSLAGQVARVQAGKPYVMFGDGRLTACKPISEHDLACFIADCLSDPAKHNAILPIGGPGPALTPRDQGEMLFRLCRRKPRFRAVPVRMFSLLIAVLDALSRIFPALVDKAEFARIGRYYATHSMLAINPQSGEHDEQLTPSTGADTLEQFYARVLREGLAGQELGEHAMF